jgi:peroxiredoxin
MSFYSINKIKIFEMNLFSIKKCFIIALFSLLPVFTFSQGYEISLKVKNLADSVVYFGHHYGSGYFINDSNRLDKNGQIVYKGEKPLEGGIYFLLLPNGNYFDFLIDRHQYFNITCDTSNFLYTVNFKNSFQNQKFYDYQKFLNQQYAEIGKLKELQKRHITNIDTIMLIEDNIQLLYNKIYLKKEEIISDHPDSIISVILKAGLPIIPPPAPADENGKMLDSLFAYKYVKAHFFDNIDFSDPRLLRTGILQNKILEFINQMSVPHYDSLIQDVDRIVSLAAANDEVYKYVLNNFFQYFNKSNLISDENVFIHIAEKYYLGGKTPWVLPELNEKLAADINKRKLNMIGATAPDFKMKDEKGKIIGLREHQNKFTILYFYDVDCEICHVVSPELMNFYRIIRDRGVNVFGIYVGKDKNKWLKYIEEKKLHWINVWDPENKTGFREKYNIAGTPVIFLLDEDQKIVIKKITVEQLMGYFNSI